jgi:hypothetical protein
LAGRYDTPGPKEIAMKNAEDVRGVGEIQADLACVAEELMVLRRRLRALRAETLETPSYKLAQRADGEEPGDEEETIGWLLEGAIVESIGKLDELTHGLVNASQLQWGELDYSLIPSVVPDAKPAKEH